MPSKRPAGMVGFTLVWFGQLVSLMGTAMSGFALTIFAWQFSGKATNLALVGFFSFAPAVVFSPIAGALVDRWNKKLVMMLSDLAAGLMTILVMILYQAGVLQIWHLMVTGFITGTFQAFQFPAYSSAISVMIPREQFTRASSMLSLAEVGSGVLSPVLAGALIGVIGIGGILLIDIVTFLFAIGMLLLIFIPPVPSSDDGAEGKGSLLREAWYGFEYILKRPSLLGLQLVFFFGNFLGSFLWTLLAPMILARTGDNTVVLGTIQSIASIGGVIGGVAISAWGGFKRKIYGVLIGWALGGVCAAAFGLGQNLLQWAIPIFLLELTVMLVNPSNQAIWQSKVPPDVQGRVFSVRRMIAQVSAPLAMLIAGPLADYVFEPAMKQADKGLGRLLGGIFGTGPGAGMAVLIFFTSLLVVVVGLIPLGIPRLRNVETILPDFQAPQAAGENPQPVE